MSKHRNPRRWSKRTPEDWCRLAREAGEQGMAVAAACQHLGIDMATFIRWERTRPEFGASTHKIRENSARLLLSRTEKKLAMSEDKLLRALAHVRQKRAEEQAAIEKAMADGRIWTPEQLAMKIQNLKDVRADIRREERAKQKRRADAVTVAITEY